MSPALEVWSQRARSAGGRAAEFVRLHPMLAAFAACFLLQVILFNDYRDVPPYHDGLATWEVARDLAEHPWFPFREEWDTGHPPLVAWALALLWQLPGKPLAWMHLLSWAGSALLFASVFEVGRRAFGAAAGIAAGVAVLLHPVTLSQSLQVNLDLFMAAFTMLALAGVAAGSAPMVAAGLTLATMSKLNGMFAVVPFAVLGACALARAGRWRSARAWWETAWPLLVPGAVFLVYHAVKYFAVGHIFDDGKFEGGRQVALVAGWEQWLDRYHHSMYLLLEENGNKPAFAAMMAVFALLLAGLVLPGVRSRAQAVLEHPEVAGTPASPFHRPAAPAVLLLVLWLTVAVQLAFQSIREIHTLIRYFIVCYPALYVTLFGLLALLFGPWRERAVVLACGILVLQFALKWHPQNGDGPRAWLLEQRVPRPGVASNGEENLLFLDWFVLMREVSRKIDRECPEGAIVLAQWPFLEYLCDPALGITKEARSRHSPGQQPHAIVVTSTERRYPTPESVEVPEGFRRERVWEAGELWAVLLVQGSTLKRPLVLNGRAMVLPPPAE